MLALMGLRPAVSDHNVQQKKMKDDVFSKVVFITLVSAASALYAIWQVRCGVAYGRGRYEFKRSTDPVWFWIIVGGFFALPPVGLWLAASLLWPSK